MNGLLPKGTALVMRTHFDNTENNPLSIDPDQWVVFGGRSVDAMSHFHISVTYLDDQEYETLLAERKLQLAERKERDGSFGTALMSVPYSPSRCGRRDELVADPPS